MLLISSSGAYLRLIRMYYSRSKTTLTTSIKALYKTYLFVLKNYNTYFFIFSPIGTETGFRGTKSRFVSFQHLANGQKKQYNSIYQRKREKSYADCCM